MTEATNPRVSKHARNRIKERCGAGKGSVDRVFQLALERGVEREYTKGALRRWLDRKYVDDGQILVWGDKAYVVSSAMVLITVLQIPQEITRNMSKMIVLPA